MAAVFYLVAFFQGPLYSIWASILLFYNYCVHSEVIRKMFGVLVRLHKVFISCNSTVSLRGDALSREIMWKPPEGHPRENFSLSWQAYTVCVTLFRFSSLTKKQSSKNRRFCSLGTHGKHCCLISPECG